MLALKTSKQTVTKFAFSADGSKLAVAGTGRKVHLWDMAAKKRTPHLLPTFKDAVEWLGFLPDGRLFALSNMGQYATYDPGAGTTAEGALPKRWWVGDVCANADRSAFYGTGTHARRWDFDGRQLREVWAHEVAKGGRGGAVVTPAGEWVAAVSNFNNRTWLHTRDAETGEFRGEVHAANALIEDLTLLADGRTLAFVRLREYCGPTQNALVAGSIGEKFEVIARPARDAMFWSLALHPSGRWLAAGQDDGTVRVFDTASWREVIAYQWPVKPVVGLAFAPTGLTAAAGGEDGKFVVWDFDL
jgi:WD40 repeat protein